MESEGSLPCSQQSATGPILSQMNSFHNFPPYFPKIQSNIIIFPSTPILPHFSFVTCVLRALN